MTPQRWKFSSKKEERSSPSFSSSLVLLYGGCSVQTFLACSRFGLRAAISTSFFCHFNEGVEEFVGSNRPVRCLLLGVVLRRRLIVAVQSHVYRLCQPGGGIVLRRGG